MPPRLPPPPKRLFRVHRDGPDRFVVRERRSVYGVDKDIHQAVGSARREAMLASKEGFRVIVEVELPDGKWKREAVVDPPQRS